MKKGELHKLYEDVPDRIDSQVRMLEANSAIPIYTGDFELSGDIKTVILNGTISYNWFPNSGVYFEGIPKIDLKEFISFNIENKALKLIKDGIPMGDVFIISTNYGHSESNLYIKGVFSGQAVIGDISISVEKIIFSVPNLRDFFGDPIKVVTENNLSTCKGRVTLKNEESTIILDKSDLYKDLKTSVDKRGGYLILYSGELSLNNKSITLESSREIFHCLDTYLSFLNGRRTSGLFAHGLHQGNVKWVDYSDYHVDTYKAVTSWPPRHSIGGINEAWISFSSMWKSPDDKNFLTSFIHWYVEANGLVAFSEGSIILAQTALELVYNWWIVENKAMITGKDSENISASNKIRLLLSQIGLDCNVPKALSELNKFVKTNPEIDDAPEAVVQIRNAIIHSQKEKRKKLNSIHYKAKYEALQLCLWYMELSLLKILNYHGKYFNRCSNSKYMGPAEELVPWNKEK